MTTQSSSNQTVHRRRH